MSNEYRNEDFFQVLGHISVFFATLDFFVSELILCLVQHHTDNRPIFTDRSTLGQKFIILENLKGEDVTNPLVLERVQQILPDAQEVSRERNRYIHDQWLFRPEGIPEGKIGRIKLDITSGPILRTEITEHTIAELYEFLKRIGGLQKQFGNLMKIAKEQSY